MAGRRSMIRFSLSAYFAVYVGWFMFSGSTGDTRTFISDGAYLPLGVAGIVLAGRTAVRSRRSRDRLVWALIALALLFREQGDGTWWWLEAVRHQSPFPSLADVGYSGFYPVLIAALALMPVRKQTRRASVANLLDVLAMVGGAFMLVWYLALGAAVQAGLDSLEHALNISYPLWDLLLLLAAGRIVLRGSDPRWTNATRWLVAGACSFVVADVGFGYLSTTDGFTGGGWLDLFWVGALLCFALAAPSRPATRAASSDADRHVHLLPVVAIIASYAVVAKVAVGLPLYPVGGVLIADLVITIVVVIRQLLAVADHRALAQTYRAAASTDALTGLSSRNHFLDEARIALGAHGGRCALVMVDLDHFKNVNDQYGHLVGDSALQAVAAHLRAATREVDLVARFGGDEFVVLLVGLDTADADAVVARIADGSCHLDEPDLVLSVSIGWSCSSTDLTRLLSHADVALYAAKAAGRGCAVAAHDLVVAPGPTSTPDADGRSTTSASPASTHPSFVAALNVSRQ
jgi:diguanylate cyclase (GGDEF)-like protein